MARRRDSQRQRVYDAEQRAWGWWYVPKSELLTVKECQAFIDKILASKWLANQDDMRMQLSLVQRKGGVAVIPGRGAANASVDDRYGESNGWLVRVSARPSISVGVQARQKVVLCHELAHILQPSGSTAHGWEFCDVYLRLVRHFLGKESHDKLKAEFKAGGVRFTKPRAKRQLTPQQREAATARLAAARAARAASAEEAA